MQVDNKRLSEEWSSPKISMRENQSALDFIKTKYSELLNLINTLCNSVDTGEKVYAVKLLHNITNSKLKEIYDEVNKILTFFDYTLLHG